MLLLHAFIVNSSQFTVELALSIAFNFIQPLSPQHSAVVEVIQLNCISVEAILKRIMRIKKR